MPPTIVRASGIGDAFRCRYEMFLADPQIEPRKTRREIEVAIGLAD